MKRESHPDDIRSALEQLFPSAGIEVAGEIPRGDRRVDCEARVKLHAQSLRLLIEFKDVSSEARLKESIELLRSRQASQSEGLWVFAAPFLSSSRQALLREQRAPFFDLAGNAWLWSDALHIDRRGFRNPFIERRGARDVFSDKASLVVRSLIASGPGRGVRSIADEVGLSPGYVSKVAQELERRGYVARVGGGLALRHGEELLQDWVVAYRKRSDLMVGHFVPEKSAPALIDVMRERLAGFDEDFALAGQAGANVVARYAEFDVVDVYVRSGRVAQAVAQALGARLVRRGANLRIGEPYYRESAFFGVQMVQGLPVVCDLQLFLDLYDYPQRGREQAEQILERRLRPRLEAAERA